LVLSEERIEALPVAARQEAGTPGAAEEAAAVAGKELVVYRPSALQTDVRRIMDDMLTRRIEELLQQERYEEAALLLFIGIKTEEDLQSVADFVKKGTFIGHAAFMLSYIKPALAAAVLVRTIQIQKRKWFLLKTTEWSDQEVAWAAELLKTLDWAQRGWEKARTAPADILQHILVNQKVAGGSELAGRIIQKAMGEEYYMPPGSAYKTFGDKLYDAMDTKLFDFRDMLCTPEEVKEKGTLLRGKLPVALALDEDYAWNGTDDIAAAVASCIGKDNLKSASDIIFMKLPPLQAYDVLETLTTNEKYRALAPKVYTLFRYAEPWMAARFFSEVYALSGKDRKNWAFGRIVRMLAAVREHNPPEKGEMGPAAAILKEMITRSPEAGGNRELVRSFFDPDRAIEREEAIQDIYGDLAAHTPDVADIETFFQTGKLFMGDLSDQDRLQMIDYWRSRISLTAGNTGEAVEGVRALGKLKLPPAPALLLKEYFIISGMSADDMNVSASAYSAYKDALLAALKACGGAEIAKGLVMMAKGGAAVDEKGIEPLFGMLDMGEKVDFHLWWIKENGDIHTIDQLRKAFGQQFPPLSFEVGVPAGKTYTGWYVAGEPVSADPDIRIEYSRLMINHQQIAKKFGAMAPDVVHRVFRAFVIHPILDRGMKLDNQLMLGELARMINSIDDTDEPGDWSLPEQDIESLARIVRANSGAMGLNRRKNIDLILNSVRSGTSRADTRLPGIMPFRTAARLAYRLMPEKEIRDRFAQAFRKTFRRSLPANEEIFARGRIDRLYTTLSRFGPGAVYLAMEYHGAYMGRQPGGDSQTGWYDVEWRNLFTIAENAADFEEFESGMRLLDTMCVLTKQMEPWRKAHPNVEITKDILSSLKKYPEEFEMILRYVTGILGTRWSPAPTYGAVARTVASIGARPAYYAVLEKTFLQSAEGDAISALDHFVPKLAEVSRSAEEFDEGLAALAAAIGTARAAAGADMRNKQQYDLCAKLARIFGNDTVPAIGHLCKTPDEYIAIMRLFETYLFTPEFIRIHTPDDYSAVAKAVSVIARHAESFAEFKELLEIALDVVKMHYLESSYQLIAALHEKFKGPGVARDSFGKALRTLKAHAGRFFPSYAHLLVTDIMPLALELSATEEEFERILRAVVDTGAGTGDKKAGVSEETGMSFPRSVIRAAKMARNYGELIELLDAIARLPVGIRDLYAYRAALLHEDPAVFREILRAWAGENFRVDVTKSEDVYGTVRDSGVFAADADVYGAAAAVAQALEDHRVYLERKEKEAQEEERRVYENMGGHYEPQQILAGEVTVPFKNGFILLGHASGGAVTEVVVVRTVWEKRALRPAQRLDEQARMSELIDASQ